jgi:hypothetical protein
MRVQIVSVNHGTTAYTELLLRSLLAHHRDRTELSILVLDNGSGEQERLEWARDHGVEIRQSGYSLDAPVTTHGEILRDAVLAMPGCDAYLFVDSDVCFVADNTIEGMAKELSDEPGLFAVQAIWSHEDGSTYDPTTYVSGRTSRVRESVRMFGQDDWGEPYEWDIAYADRVHPFCTLVRNDAAFRIAVEVLGLSPAQTQCVRGARWFDTLGLLTQVMKTHSRSWRTSSQRVIHFGNASWRPEQAAANADRRDALLTRYRAAG